MLEEKLKKVVITANESKFLRALSAKDIHTLEKYYTEMTGEIYKVNLGCGYCSMKICQMLYRFVK